MVVGNYTHDRQIAYISNWGWGGGCQTGAGRA
jgi:hypothetical protein